MGKNNPTQTEKVQSQEKKVFRENYDYEATNVYASKEEMDKIRKMDPDYEKQHQENVKNRPIILEGIAKKQEQDSKEFGGGRIFTSPKETVVNIDDAISKIRPGFFDKVINAVKNFANKVKQIFTGIRTDPQNNLNNINNRSNSSISLRDGEQTYSPIIRQNSRDLDLSLKTTEGNYSPIQNLNSSKESVVRSSKDNNNPATTQFNKVDATINQATKQRHKSEMLGKLTPESTPNSPPGQNRNKSNTI